RFAICGDCADALRVFKLRRANSLKCFMGGQPALIIPHVHSGEPTTQLQELVRNVFEERGRDVVASENRLLRALAGSEKLLVFHILWATVGQDLDDVRGFLTDVPSTRLRELSTINKDITKRWNGAAPQSGRSVFPKHLLRELDLGLDLFNEVLKHPGGKKEKSRNQGELRGALLRKIVGAVYTGHRMDDRRLWAEILSIARAYLTDASADARHASTLWQEVQPREGKAMWLTAAGWVRHVAFFLHYLRTLEVLDMSKEPYQPKSELLAPYFTEGSGLDTKDKAFAFLLGLLLGKLMKTQAARHVNVHANALSWLRRGTLAGRDLPELYAKVRQKLLEYNVEASSQVREVVKEISRIGFMQGTAIGLDGPRAMYFLLLGQALVDDILPPKTKKTNDVKSQEDTK
ncbi:MAG: hypothetical protein KAI47_05585, partial [Deltaproteobacteria bacterium]|nr:hypothetical protein [Deltaproteobacteria bacterium]